MFHIKLTLISQSKTDVSFYFSIWTVLFKSSLIANESMSETRDKPVNMATHLSGSPFWLTQLPMRETTVEVI
jgi:hypothetical protein